MFIILLVTGTDQLIIYSDIIEYKSGSIFKIFRKYQLFKITDIKLIRISGNYSTGDELYNPTYNKDKSLNKIEIELKDGNIVNIQTNIYIVN